jgi:hypothetical protein
MSLRCLLFFIFLFSIIKIDAQVRRKGVTPLRRGNYDTTEIPSKYSLAQFQGKWQEYKRTDHNNNPVSFNDSLLLAFTDSNKVETKTNLNNRMTMKGTAEIDPGDILTAAADEYKIVSVSQDEIVLDDEDQYIHWFKKVNQFFYESLGKNQVNQDSYTTPIQATIVDIIGNWSVYKRDAKPGAITDDMFLIKYLNITTKTGDNTATGIITFYKGENSQQLPVTVTLNGTNIKIIAGQNTWDLSVYKADGKEFIFGNPGLLYFCKAEK